MPDGGAPAARSPHRARRLDRQPAALDQGGRDHLRPLQGTLSRRHAGHGCRHRRAGRLDAARRRPERPEGRATCAISAARIARRAAAARRARCVVGRGGDRAADRGEGVRPMDRGDVPDVPPASPRRPAGGRPWHRERRAAAVSAAQAARREEAATRWARRGGLTDRWRAGICGSRSGSKTPSPDRAGQNREAGATRAFTQEGEAGDDRDERAALAEERLAHEKAAACSEAPADGRRRTAGSIAARGACSRGTRSPIRDSSSRSSHRTIEWYSTARRPATNGASQRSCALTANPSHSRMLPR